MAGKSAAAKRRAIPFHNLQQSYMKIVTSETCAACNSKCARGIKYLNRMQTPGAVGLGVPCVLTSYKLQVK